MFPALLQNQGGEKLFLRQKLKAFFVIAAAIIIIIAVYIS